MSFKNRALNLFAGKGRRPSRPSGEQQPRRSQPRPYLSEIILGVRKKGRPPKDLQGKFTAIRNMLDSFKERFSFAPSRGPQPANPGAPLSKYLSYKKANLTPLDCRVETEDVLRYFSRDVQEYLKSGLTLFNVSSVPIAQVARTADEESDNEDSDAGGAETQTKANKKKKGAMFYAKKVPPIDEGDVVWAKHKNARYYMARVVNIKMESQMCVFFPEDQSFSKDIILSDIVDWEKLKQPTIGQRLQIRWVDGKVYDADYIGKVESNTYTVQFEDESCKHVSRENIYALDENIPKRIVSKLSYASDMKNREHLYDLERPLPEKRPVKKKTFEESK
ncbi:hypothetical protein NQ317_017812 [Molorchus minor]|uniref:Tudor domain-containing protein n=1 Tax=Molorchus minor TaxID=1323400 RepID=A0ABQ9K0M9_9CUCU|nr:hypothetical protein NQ317_017812 [Molorchus minor]